MSDPPSPLALTVVVITRDAGAQLAECLASVDFAAEKLIVDSGSEDDTVQIARGSGARVIAHEWQGFGPQKNYAVAQAANDWVLCLDADERVSAELARAICAALAAPRYAAYTMPRCNRFLGRWLRHGEGYPDWNLRLFDRRHARWSDDLLHLSGESLDAYLAKQNRYTTLQAEALYARGERFSTLRLILSPVLRFFRFYVLRAGFLDGVAGIVHITIGCHNSFCKYAKLRALELEEGAR